MTILDEIRADNARGQARFDEFARDVMSRFDGIDNRFDGVDRFDDVDRFDGVDDY